MSFRLSVAQDIEIVVHEWAPPAEVPVRAVVQIAHGMAEHGKRYARAAERLGAAGYVVYAPDHRGHGESVRVPQDRGFFSESGGWEAVLQDLFKLNRYIAEAHPGVPIFLLGHSMGSLLAQCYVLRHPETIAGLMLSGSSGKVGILAKVGAIVARIERLRLGPRGTSPLLTKMSFGSFNGAIANPRTDFDWLSRDSAEVDRYVADPLCGFDFTVQGWIDVLHGTLEAEDRRNIARIPSALPIYVFAGAEDPVGKAGRAVMALIREYEAAGLSRLTHRLYEGARHELFNETCREQVQDDLVAWLDRVLASADS